ncbi:ribbon-helix-helix domain-containing protein [Sphingomicrobium nitratireducens]|uniref:ribbon-helix-helix domain-containing protein n=1 Tax=Sphingomicrobium nitratireducens TaxID=2964666 RepID=UPI00223F9505|nr:ribbon-helix-helix domain-containing protein [Sphingomicrobium nitratireducens]
MDDVPLPASPLKRSVTIAGHETSISLEPVFWEALSQAAKARRLPLNALIAEIDLWRFSGGASARTNLASAIRQWIYADSMALIDETNAAPLLGA